MDNYNDYNNYGRDNDSHVEPTPNYHVDPVDNSYRYTGAAEDTQSNSGTWNQTYSGTYRNESTDRYYSPYERRTMEESGRKQRREKKKGFGVTVAKCACLAAVFGLVAGGVFGGVNYLIPTNPNSQVSTQPAPTLTTSAQDSIGKTAPTGTSVQTLHDVSGIVEDVMPSIVAITNMTQTQYFNWFGQSGTRENEYAGSGIIVSEDDEYLYIATNNHVVAGATTLTVQFCDDSTVAAEIRGNSPSNDLAVVKVNKSDVEPDTMKIIKVATINDRGEERVGQPTIAIGNSLGYGQSVTTGVISALEREVTSTDSSTGETTTNVLTQTDASINPGNSGGALLNFKGEVIGINSAKYGGEYVDGMGFAIPMSTAAPIIQELITREKVTEDKAAYLGVSGVDVDDEVAKTYNMPTGIFIAKVYEGSAADKAGLQQGDIITKFDNQTVGSMEAMQELMQYHEAGSTVTLTVSRADNGQYIEHEIEVTLGSKS